MSADQPRPGRHQLDDLAKRVYKLETQQRAALTRKPYMPLQDFLVQGEPIPIDGALIVDYTGTPDVLDTATHIVKYGFGGKWHELELAQYEIKLYDDRGLVIARSPKFTFAIPLDLNGTSLVTAHAFQSTVASAGLTTIQLRNTTTGVDMLSTKMTIDPGEYTSFTAATPSVVDPTNDRVSTGDMLALNVEIGGTGAKGAGVILKFGPPVAL